MPFAFTPDIYQAQGSYFAAMNTPRGFVSFFHTLFSRYRRYIIKGGPGTGKSTLMKKVANAAEARGLSLTRYYCSSDTTSLDAIVIPALSLVLLDGTPPHAEEPYAVGAWDRYLDLSRFIDPDLLVGDSDAIQTLTNEKSRAYRRAYRMLKALNEVENDLDELRRDCFLFEKCEKAVAALLSRLGIHKSEDKSVSLLPVSAFGTSGYLALDSDARRAKTTVFISDYGRVSFLIFELLQKELARREIGYTYSLSPMRETVDHIFVPATQTLITALPMVSEFTLTVNAERFLVGRGKGMLKAVKKETHLATALFEETKAALKKAGTLHGECESHYKKAMDFHALSSYTNALIAEIFA